MSRNRPPVADPAAALTVSHAVRAALDTLGVDQRQVLVLRYFLDLSEAQTADVLRVAPGTVKSRASRAIASLAKDSSLRELLVTRNEEDR